MNKENFEEQLKQLEEAVAKLESGELTLEESLQVYESGMQRVCNCRHALQEAEQRVERLQEGADGEPVLVPFEPPVEG